MTPVAANPVRIVGGPLNIHSTPGGAITAIIVEWARRLLAAYFVSIAKLSKIVSEF